MSDPSNRLNQLVDPAAALRVAEARVQALEDALRRYGDHDKGCAYNNPYSPPRGFNRHPCSCGFDATLAAPASKGAEHGKL